MRWAAYQSPSTPTDLPEEADFFDRGGVGEEGEDDHGDLAAQTGECVDVEHPLQ